MPLKATAVTGHVAADDSPEHPLFKRNKAAAPPVAAAPGTPYPKFLTKGDLGRTVKDAAEEKAARASGWGHPLDSKGA
jgi:hypothetical protein